MHLKASKDLKVNCRYLPEKINLEKGETIHTENSHKYTEENIANLAPLTGLKIRKIYTDERKWFSLVHLVC